MASARLVGGRLVQIKATQTRRVALRAEPQHLIVLALHANGAASEVYNGPGARPWAGAGRVQSNGQRPISFKTLGELMEAVPETKRLPVT